MDIADRIATAATFLWLGMVVAISFVEAPLKFRAPGITLPLGLGIGRLVFRALNAFEVFFAAVLFVTRWVDRTPAAVTWLLAIAMFALVLQLVGVRPRLSRRTDAVLAGVAAPRSRAHLAYVGLELIKVVALIAAGSVLLSG